jgi:7-cyano-7-deazaguanine synthase
LFPTSLPASTKHHGQPNVSRNALLLSGGMDSIALAYGLRPDLCITIDYGQRAAGGEIRASSAICAALNLKHRLLKVDCSEVGSGDMSSRPAIDIAPVPEWWPFRNQLLITFAAAVAIQEGISSVSIGSVVTDGAHADGRPEFFRGMRELIRQQEGSIVLDTPAIDKTTVELCRLVQIPFTLLAWAHSCHVAPYACGKCRGCCKHRDCMKELGYDIY